MRGLSRLRSRARAGKRSSPLSDLHPNNILSQKECLQECLARRAETATLGFLNSLERREEKNEKTESNINCECSAFASFIKRLRFVECWCIRSTWESRGRRRNGKRTFRLKSEHIKYLKYFGNVSRWRVFGSLLSWWANIIGDRLVDSRRSRFLFFKEPILDVITKKESCLINYHKVHECDRNKKIRQGCSESESSQILFVLKATTGCWMFLAQSRAHRSFWIMVESWWTKSKWWILNILMSEVKSLAKVNLLI